MFINSIISLFSFSLVTEVLSFGESGVLKYLLLMSESFCPTWKLNWHLAWPVVQQGWDWVCQF